MLVHTYKSFLDELNLKKKLKKVAKNKANKVKGTTFTFS